MNTEERFKRTITDYGLIKKGDSVLAALSGGPDSIALLYLLNDLKDSFRLKLAAAHLDHGLRAGSSKDREFCRETCRRLKIKFYSRRVDIAKMAKKGKKGLEETGRDYRYAFFESICSSYGFRKIATGHTMNDNAETILFNLARGTGLRGLAGIPPKRGKIIRPLLGITKTEIVKWLKFNKIPHKNDPTNRSSIYSRNIIRNRILPEFERINPGIVNSLSRFSLNISESIELIDKAGVRVYERAVIRADKSKIVLDLRELAGYDEGIVKLAITEAFNRLSKAGKSPSFDILARVNDTVNGRSGAKSPLGKGIWIEKSQNQVSVYREKASSADESTIPLIIPGLTYLNGCPWDMKTTVLKKNRLGSLKTKQTTALLDNSKVIEPEVRFARKGDRIRPLGMKGTRLLSDLLIDKKIPSFTRSEIPLVISMGEIAWIGGVTVSENFKVDSSTAEVLKIELCRR